MITIVSDFDNTFDTLHYLDNIDAIGKFVKEGNYFFLTSERNHGQLFSEIKDFNIPYSFLICDDGALIYDFYDHKIYQKPINKNDVHEIFKMMEKSHLFYEIWYDNGEEYTLYADEDVYKIIAKPKDYNKIEKFLNVLQEKYPTIKIQILESWIHIMDGKVSKSNAIKELSKMYDFDEKKIYTVGDEINDLSMIKDFKGFAMKSGIDEIKKYAIKEVETFDEIIKYIKEDSE